MRPSRKCLPVAGSAAGGHRTRPIGHYFYLSTYWSTLGCGSNGRGGAQCVSGGLLGVLGVLDVVGWTGTAGVLGAADVADLIGGGARYWLGVPGVPGVPGVMNVTDVAGSIGAAGAADKSGLMAAVGVIGGVGAVCSCVAMTGSTRPISHYFYCGLMSTYRGCGLMSTYRGCGLNGRDGSQDAQYRFGWLFPFAYRTACADDDSRCPCVNGVHGATGARGWFGAAVAHGAAVGAAVAHGVAAAHGVAVGAAGVDGAAGVVDAADVAGAADTMGVTDVTRNRTRTSLAPRHPCGVEYVRTRPISHYFYRSCG